MGRKSPLVKMRAEGGSGGAEDQAAAAADRLLKAPLAREEQMRSPSNDSIKSHTGIDSNSGSSVIVKTGNGILRTPIVLQKPRPWSVVGNEPKSSGIGSESSKTTPEKLDDGNKIFIIFSSHFI